MSQSLVVDINTVATVFSHHLSRTEGTLHLGEAGIDGGATGCPVEEVRHENGLSDDTKVIAFHWKSSED